LPNGVEKKLEIFSPVSYNCLVVIYLALPPGETTRSDAYALADLINQEAHPVVANVVVPNTGLESSFVG